MSIETFRGEHFYLSNMYEVDNWLETEVGILVPTSEHDYHMRRLVNEEHKILVANARAKQPEPDQPDERTFAQRLHGVAAKRMAYRLMRKGAPVIDDWENARLPIMHDVVKRKFQRNLDLMAKLIATGTMELVEGNDHNDTFWGVSPPRSGNGQNHLGKILMRVRAELTSDQ